MDTSNKEPNSFSSLGGEKPSLDRSNGRHRQADRKNTQAVQIERQTESANFDDVVPSKPYVNYVKPSSLYNGLICS